MSASGSSDCSSITTLSDDELYEDGIGIGMETNSQISEILIPDDISKHQSNPNSNSNLPPSHITNLDLERNLQQNKFSSNNEFKSYSLANGINHTPSDYLISEHGNSETESSKIDEHTNLNPMSSNISLNHQVLPVTNANVLDDAKISAMSIDGFVGVDRNSVKQFHKQVFNVEKNSVKQQCGQKSEGHIRTSLAARLLKENLENLSSNKSGHSSASEFSEESGTSRLSNLGQARFSTSSFTRKSLSRNSMTRNSLSRNSQSRNSQSRNSLARDSISKKNNTNQKNNFPRTSVARNSVNTNKTPNNSVFDQTSGNLRTSLMENITNITPQNFTPQNNVITDDSSKSGVVANIERNSRVRKMSIATRNTIEDIKFLQEKEKWKDPTVVDKDRVFKKKRLRSRLRPVNFVLKTYYNCVGPFQNDVAPEV